MRFITPKLIILLVAGLLLLPVSETAGAAPPTFITRAYLDLNHDGKPDEVVIRMASGKFYRADDPADESCPSCACGAPKYKGQFSIEVLINGKPSVAQNLNALFGGLDELEFWAEPWQIAFDDYNRDGQMDFNLGQFANCNGWAYRLFTISRDGRVSRLEVGEGNPDGEIFASDDNNSTRVIRSNRRGFYTHGYFNGADPVGWYTSLYRWNAKMRSFVYVKDVYDRIQKKSFVNKPHWAN